jgi:hypothetical protein
MWGVGLARTYRLGGLIHVPVLLYNRTFNPKWGVEALFPAKVSLRRNFGTNSILQLGYELEGNAYFLGKADGGYLRRGEIKPRITFDRQVTGFLWLSLQAGYRINYRFDVFDTQNPMANERPRLENHVLNPFYFNVSLNFVSP